jgi:hypothetical protein
VWVQGTEVHHIVVEDWQRMMDPRGTLFVSIPSLLDSSLCPEGMHVFHAFTPDWIDAWQVCISSSLHCESGSGCASPRQSDSQASCAGPRVSWSHLVFHRLYVLWSVEKAFSRCTGVLVANLVASCVRAHVHACVFVHMGMRVCVRARSCVFLHVCVRVCVCVPH